MRRLAVAAITIAAAGALYVAAASPAPAADAVTLRMERFYDEACRCYKFRFSGSISSEAANEYVSVLQQRCGQRFSTAVAGASTREGGAWDVVPTSFQWLGGSATFRARWKNQLSAPVTYRAELLVYLSKVSAGRYRAFVSNVSDQNFKRRIVELQRLVAGQWRLVRRARFAPYRSGFAATFKASRTGTFRAFVPARSASPCYAASASKPLTSTPPRPGSGHVVDRTLLCSTAMQGGLRQFTIRAYPGGQQTPSLSVTTNWVPDWTLAGAGTTLMQLNPERCTESQAHVPLSSRSLRGGPASGAEFDCESPERVLLRIRAVFTSSTALQQDRTFGYLQLVARGEVTQAAVVVRTQRGKQLAYATMSSSGTARLYRAGGCIEDDS
jgi:hypothetical protein